MDTLQSVVTHLDKISWTPLEIRRLPNSTAVLHPKVESTASKIGAERIGSYFEETIHTWVLHISSLTPLDIDDLRKNDLWSQIITDKGDIGIIFPKMPF